MMKEEKSFHIQDIINNPIKLQEDLFQFVNQNASTYERFKNFNFFLSNPKIENPVVSYQYDPDFLFGVDTSLTQERMLEFLLGKNESKIFYNKESLSVYIDNHYQDLFHKRYAYQENNHNRYLELSDAQAKALLKRCLLNYINHFYLTFTFSTDDQSQQLENDKIIEILKNSDGIYLPYTKEMFDAIDVNPLLLDRELFIYEDGFVYQGDNAYQIHSELKKLIASLPQVDNYSISYKGKLSEEILKKLYELQKEVIVSESWILIHGYLSRYEQRDKDSDITLDLFDETACIIIQIGRAHV